MNCAPTEKFQKLQKIIRSYEKVVIAFSGGCDSAFVLKVSVDVLGRKNVKAVLAKSPSLPESELLDARDTAGEIGADLEIIETNEMENPNYVSNPVNRCYFCKSELYLHLLPKAQEFGAGHILNGTNLDDLGDWRPGLKAAGEQDIKSPLIEAGMKKEDIRSASKLLGLSTWSKPQAACLSSRIPFGIEITEERLRQVEKGEEILKNLGFEMVRVRWAEKRATVEVGAEETRIFFKSQEIREKALNALKTLGFQSVDLSLQGYRSGLFNPKSSLRKAVKAGSPRPIYKGAETAPLQAKK